MTTQEIIKKAKEPQAADAMVNINLRINADLRDQFNKYAKESDVTVTALLTTFIKAVVDDKQV